MIALDTNIWIYAHDTRDLTKQRTAQHLIESSDPMALLWQVGCEFIAAARKLAPQGFGGREAWQALSDMRGMAEVILLPEPDLWDRSRRLQETCGLHFWDGLIVAACLGGAVETLYSEDLAGLREVEGLEIVNPFADPSAAS